MIARQRRAPSGTVGMAASLLAAAALALVTGVGAGCGARSRKAAEEVPRVGPTPRATPTNAGPVTSQRRALEVIRTRIAGKEQGAEGGAPAPEPEPTIVVEMLAGGVMAAPDLGLTWTERPGGMFDAEDARAYCDGLAAEGGAWRLPEIWELETIVRCDPGVCRRDGSVELWSATAHQERGLETWDCRRMTRSHRAVGMAQVVCVGRYGR